MRKIGDLIFRELISEDELSCIVERSITMMDDLIESSMGLGNEIIVIPIMNGAVRWINDLMSRTENLYEMRSVIASSYNGGLKSGDLSITGLGWGFKDKHVIILDDILESGNTIVELHKRLMKFTPARIDCMFLFGREDGVQNGELADRGVSSVTVFKELPKDEFIVGYGLDYKGMGRNLNSIYSKCLKNYQNTNQ